MNFSFYLLYNLILVIQYSVCSSKLFFFWYKNRYFVIYTFIIYIIYIFYIRVLNKFYFVFGQRYFFFTLKNSSTQKIIGVEKNCIGRRWVRSEPFALKYWEGGGERLALCRYIVPGTPWHRAPMFRVVWVFHSFVHTHVRHQIVYVKIFTASTLVGPFHQQYLRKSYECYTSNLNEPHIVLHLPILLLRLYIWIFVMLLFM